MEDAEPPECPVCLQLYDSASVIPRVLTCGHTTCEPCLKQLPNPFPNTIRCTVCTLLVKFPNCPSSLPKNLDLLHFSSVLQNSHRSRNDDVVPRSSPAANGETQSASFPLTLKSWSYEFYCKWRKWILPEDCISIQQGGSGSENDGATVYGKVVKSFESENAMGCVLMGEESVGLVTVGSFVEGEEYSRFFKPSYESRIVEVLCGMKEEKRNGIIAILNATHRVRNVGRIYGFWYNCDDKFVYMVCKMFASHNSMTCMLRKQDGGNEGLNSDEMGSLAMIGMEICEILSDLHMEGIVIGFLSVDCLRFDDFSRVYVDLSEVFNTGRIVSVVVQKAFKETEFSFKNNLLDKNLVFICPEMLLGLCVKEGLVYDGQKSEYEVVCASDVWSLACLLVWLIVGSSFVEELGSFLNVVGSSIKDGTISDSSDFHGSWVEKIVTILESRLGSEYSFMQEILCRCLGLEPENRPVIAELWKSLRELVVKQSKYGNVHKRNQDVKRGKLNKFIVLAEVSWMEEKTDREVMDGFTGKDENDKADLGLRSYKDITMAMSGGRFKYIEMKGHLDCITGLSIAGDYLFSSSYDKIVNVWLLQDFKHVQSFKGHEHKVMAVVALDGEQPLCISGDNEGIICIWKANFPFSEVPLKKLYEKKDWRYSGIHAMAVSGTESLYTGSGDKLVKAWSLQDYTLTSIMSGHKSVVSSLIVCDGVLYSGSWDGTVRLWSLSDHSPLAVLGEDKIGNVSSVLCLSAENGLLFVGHENGCIKIWLNDSLLKSTQSHKGAIFSIKKKGKWLFSGGWDRTICLQEVSSDGFEVTPIGCIACNSTATGVLYWQGKLLVGQTDKIIKVYHGV